PYQSIGSYAPFIYIDLFMFYIFFFNDTATTEIYTLSLHDALPISWDGRMMYSLSKALGFSLDAPWQDLPKGKQQAILYGIDPKRSEEHTSELQSRGHLVCRLLLEKKKTAYQHPKTKNKTHLPHT